MAGIRITTDTLTPGIQKLARSLDASGRKQFFESLATELHAATVEPFTSPADRPAPWVAKKDGSPSNLSGEPTPNLSKSFQVEADSREGRVTTPAVYAAAHQFGYPTRNLPARPFFPFLDGKITNDARERLKSVAEDKLKSLFQR